MAPTQIQNAKKTFNIIKNGYKVGFGEQQHNKKLIIWKNLMVISKHLNLNGIRKAKCIFRKHLQKLIL